MGGLTHSLVFDEVDLELLQRCQRIQSTPYTLFDNNIFLITKSGLSDLCN